MKNWTEALYSCALNSTWFYSMRRRRRQHCEALMCQTRLSGFVCRKYLNISIDIPPGRRLVEKMKGWSSAAPVQIWRRLTARLVSFRASWRKNNNKKTRRKKVLSNFYPRPLLLFQAEGLFCGYEPLSWWQERSFRGVISTRTKRFCFVLCSFLFVLGVKF